MPVHDPETRDRRLRECVHDYFFVKILSILRPGGILAFITSRYTLDKRKSVVRRHLARHAELLAAVRLPSSAFKQNAGTEVVADVIILRKCDTPIDLDQSEAPVWIEAGTQRLFDEYGGEAELPINKLFIARPDLTLGKPRLDRGMYSHSELVIEPVAGDLATALRDRLISQFPAGPLSAPVALGHATINRIRMTWPAPDQTESPSVLVHGAKSSDARSRASALFKLYLQAKHVIRHQVDDADDQILADAQRELNRFYDRFRMHFGPINGPGAARGLDHRSPILPFLRALEEPDGNGGVQQVTRR